MERSAKAVGKGAAVVSSARKVIVARDLKRNMPIRLFVGNLPYDTTEAELQDHFAAVAPVTFLMIPKDRETGRARNFAFVEYGERAQAEEAVKRFNNQLFNGRPLGVSEARPRDEMRPTNAPARPPMARSYASAEPQSAPPSGDKPNRNFGPDAAPPRRNKGKGAPKSERGAKGPMRVLVSNQFVGGEDDDDDFDDDYEDDFNNEAEVDDSNEEDYSAYLNGAEAQPENQK
jgi:cold-inducible RNA-binding protein